MILCGIRDVRDYRIQSSAEQAVITGGSAFNVKAESLRLGDLSATATETLLAQHTAETGQQWTEAARREIRRLSKGQPWLVNALAYRACDLTWTTQVSLPHEPTRYVVDGELQMEQLLAAFRTFFREHSEHWVERFQYKEAGPQLLLQAFLQRIVNAGGRIEREYGLGRMRTDLLILWPVGGELRKTVIECKLLRGSLDRTLRDGLGQTRAYMERCAAADHLVIFDRTPRRSWDDKIFRRTESAGGPPVAVWGM